MFGSGAGAISAAVIASVRAGDHAICVARPYSWTRAVLRDLLGRFGVATSFIDGTDDRELRIRVDRKDAPDRARKPELDDVRAAGHRRRRRAGEGTRHPHALRQQLRDAAEPVAARARHRSRRAFGDEVPQRPQRRRRRRAVRQPCADPRDLPRPVHDARRDPRAARCVADDPRPAHAADPHAAHRGDGDRSARVPRIASESAQGVFAARDRQPAVRSHRAPAARRERSPDDRSRRTRRRGRRAFLRQPEAIPDDGFVGRLRVADVSGRGRASRRIRRFVRPARCR